MPPIKVKVPWTITLTQVDNGGLIVQVGCKNLVFEDPLMAVRELGRLYENPETMMQEYTDKYGWASAVGGAEATPGPPLNRLASRGRLTRAAEGIERLGEAVRSVPETDQAREVPGPFPGALPDPTGSPF